MIRKILFENVCRLCGQEKQNGVNVLNGPRGNELLSKINTRLSKEIVNFYPEDGLPKFVCSDCEVIINSFSEFCNMVKSVQQKLEIISNSCGETSQCLEQQRPLGCVASVSVAAGGCITCLMCGSSLGTNTECATLHLVGHGIASPVFVCRICGSSGEGFGNLVPVVGDANWNRCSGCNSHIDPSQRNGTDNLKSIPQMHVDNQMSLSGGHVVGGPHRGQHQEVTKESENRRRKKTRSKGKEGNSQGGCDASRNFTCEVCARTFASRAHLTRHRLVHSGARPFRCDSCPAAFSQRGSLQVHSLQHTGSAPYPCPRCPRAFRFKVSLRSHILNIHSGENVTLETIVATDNGCPDNLHSGDVGMNGQTMAVGVIGRPGGKSISQEESSPGRGNRPSSDHGCDRCGKRFATAYKLGRHYRSHTGERPFECSDCGRRFSQTGNLNLHRKTHHSQQSQHHTTEDGAIEEVVVACQDGSIEGGEVGARAMGEPQGNVAAYGDEGRQVGGIQGFAEIEGSLGFGNMAVEKGVLGVDGRDPANDCILSVGDFEDGIAQSLLGETSANVVRHHHPDLSLMPSPLSCTTPTISAMDKVLSGQTLSQIIEGEGLVDKVFSKLGGGDGEGGVVYHSEGLLEEEEEEEEGFPGMETLGSRQFGEYVVGGGGSGGGREGGGERELLFLVEEEEGLGTPLPVFPSLQTPPPLPHT